MDKPGKICPACQKDIGYWTLIKAPLPNMIRCQYCKTALLYEKESWKLFVIASLFYAFLLIGFGTLYYLNPRIMPAEQALASQLFFSIFYWLAMEIRITHYLRNTQKLVIKTSTRRNQSAAA